MPWGDGISRVELLKDVMSGSVSMRIKRRSVLFLRRDHLVDIGDMLSVSFWMSSWARRSSSSETALFFSSSLSA